MIFKNESKMPSNSRNTFYFNIRPVTIIFKILGAFPLKNTFKKHGDDLMYKRLSIDTFWGIFLNIMCIIIQTKYTSMPWLLVLVPYFYLRGIATSLLSFWNDKYLINIINRIEFFDKSYKDLTGKFPSRNFTSRGRTWLILTITIFTATAIGVLRILCLDPRRSLLRISGESIVALLPWYQYHSYIILCVLLCVNISSRFLDIKSYLPILIHDSLSSSKQPWSLSLNILRDEEEHCLEKIRILHAYLSLTVDEVNKCYSSRCTLFLITFFAEISLNFIQYIYHYGMVNKIVLAIFAIQISCLYIVGSVAEDLSNSVST
ncbi:hypothetical protein L9F63_014916, partial [Diploptera punctata]